MNRTNASGATSGDYDRDGDLDLFVINNGAPPVLYRNDGSGSFSQITSGAIAEDVPSRAYSASWGDSDNDGDLDLFVGTLGFIGNSIFANNGDGTFTRLTTGAIYDDTFSGITVGASWADYDDDGDLDLFLANRDLRSDNFLYNNHGDGTFTKVTDGHVVNDSTNSRHGSWGDYDNDGDLDIFLAKVGDTFPENNSLLSNDGTGNHWVNLNCVGLATPAPEIGTKVRIKAAIDGRPVWQMREISSQTGYLSQNSLRVHFGLGNATVIDYMIIDWLAGSRDIYTNVGADTFYTAIQGASLRPVVTSVRAPESSTPVTFELSQNYPNPFNPSTTIRYELPAAGSVSLTIYDLLGKEVVTLVNAELKNAGSHSLTWDGRNAAGGKLASGIYFYRLRVGSPAVVKTRKMVLVE